MKSLRDSRRPAYLATPRNELVFDPGTFGSPLIESPQTIETDSGLEAMQVAKREIDKTKIKRAANRATRESASLERRVVPNGYVRSEKVEQFLADRRKRA